MRKFTMLISTVALILVGSTTNITQAQTTQDYDISFSSTHNEDFFYFQTEDYTLHVKNNGATIENLDIIVDYTRSYSGSTLVLAPENCKSIANNSAFFLSYKCNIGELKQNETKNLDFQVNIPGTQAQKIEFKIGTFTESIKIWHSVATSTLEFPDNMIVGRSYRGKITVENLGPNTLTNIRTPFLVNMPSLNGTLNNIRPVSGENCTSFPTTTPYSIQCTFNLNPGEKKEIVFEFDAVKVGNGVTTYYSYFQGGVKRIMQDNKQPFTVHDLTPIQKPVYKAPIKCGFVSSRRPAPPVWVCNG